ncbi:sulfurtransferase [Pseudoxanthomonas kalamensis DSM 18571]|uniref:rhodanese-like domain-containing protein n=1 Tax=Pseudoxanthomonas kalamensis TaxID=289483 RepID=UPI001391AB5D|nr:rhodanese-like domain-containing protein [Pseudoxanthomonas kalamensis]KAF1711379.1 sulfurtransferase [Pseudoxanthomonas kalamensis DSM 18571]
MTLQVSDLVAQARAEIREISPAQLAAEGLESATLVDVREAAEYATGHLPGAVNIPRGLIEFQIEALPAGGCVTDPALSAKDRPLLLYCLSGGRSALAARNLQLLGFTAVKSLDGGINAWRAAGLPVVQR